MLCESSSSYSQIRESQKRTVSEKNRLNDSIIGKTKTLVDFIQCGICFTILSIDKLPRVCQQCRNTIFCNSCVSSLHGKCPFCCKRDIKFVPVDNILQILIS